MPILQAIKATLTGTGLQGACGEPPNRVTVNWDSTTEYRCVPSSSDFVCSGPACRVMILKKVGNDWKVQLITDTTNQTYTLWTSDGTDPIPPGTYNLGAGSVLITWEQTE